MALLPIRQYPDPVLRQTAKPVLIIDAHLRQLAADMIETMTNANGVGLAAPQVGKLFRIVVIDFTPDSPDPKVLINPVITGRSGRKIQEDEGCLSFPGLRSMVKRSPRVICEALNLDGDLIEYQGVGLSARAIQHEIDHLDGLLFVDKTGPSDKQILRNELMEMESNYMSLHPDYKPSLAR